MGLLFRLTFIIHIYLFISGAVIAQDDAVIPGDQALILRHWLPVYAQPDASSPVVSEMLRGMVSRVLDVQTDSDGTNWYYLVNNAYGWVSGTIDGDIAIMPMSEEALAQIISEATTRLEADAGNVEAYLARATAYHSRRDFERALEDFNTALTYAPSDGRLYEYRADIYLDRDEFALAVDDLEQTVALGPVLPATYNRLGAAYLHQNLLNQAYDALYAVIGMQVDYGIVYANFANVNLAFNSHSQAIDLYTQAIEMDPLLVVAYANRGRAYWLRGETTAAMMDYNTAIHIDPNDAYPYALRGALHNQNGEIDAAAADLKRSVVLDLYNETGWYYLAYLYGSHGRYADALASYNEFFEKSAVFDPFVAFYRGQIHAALGDYQSALDDLNSYFERVSDAKVWAAAYVVRGYIYLYLGEYDLAAVDYQVLFTTWPDFALDYANAGAGYRVTPLRESEIPGLAAQSQDASVQLQLAHHYMEFGRWSEALTAYRNSLKLHPNDELEQFVATLENLIQLVA